MATLHLGRYGSAGVDQYTSFLKELDLILTSGYINGLLGVLSVLCVVPLLREEARRGPGQGVGPRGAGTHLKGILLRLVPATHHPTRIPSRRGDPSRGD